jgi:hypothetical protein
MFSQGNIRAFYTSKRAKALTGLPIITNDEPEDVILVVVIGSIWLVFENKSLIAENQRRSLPGMAQKYSMSVNAERS